MDTRSGQAGSSRCLWAVRNSCRGAGVLVRAPASLRRRPPLSAAHLCALCALSVLGVGSLRAQTRAVWEARPVAVTVGDTVYLTRTLPAAPGVRVRPQPLARTPAVEPLTDPAVEQRADLVTVRYAVAVFEPGEQRIGMPAIELLYPDGNNETVLGDEALVTVRSVLPAGDSLPPPRPSLAPLPRPLRSRAPFLLVVGVVVMGSGAWAMVRRRQRPRPGGPEGGAPPAGPPLEQWVEAGELRAAAASVAERLRLTLEALEPGAGAGLPTDAVMTVLRLRRPAWPLSELEQLLHALERARFAPAVPDDVLILDQQVTALAGRLAQPEPARRTGRFEVERGT